MTERTHESAISRASHGAPPIVWVAVFLIIVGVALCAVGLMVSVLWVAIAGCAAIAIGAVMALAGDIMGQAH